MLYMAYSIIVSGHNIKIYFAKFSILDLWRVENCFVHTPKAIAPPTNSNFEAFGGPWLGLDGPSGHYVGPHGRSSTRIFTK